MPDELSQEDKMKLAVGQCNYLCLSLMGITASVLGMYSTAFCAFASRNIVVNEPAATEYCANQTGTWEQSLCNNFFTNHGVGFYAWQATVPVNQQICLSYTQFVPGVGYVTPNFDTKFNSARVFAGIAQFFGLLIFFTYLFSACCPLTPDRLKCMVNYYFLAFFFQGLTFIIMRSNICQKGFFSIYFNDPQVDDIIQSASCGLMKGSNMAVAATVLYFVGMCLVPAAIPPTPIMMEPQDSEQPAQQQQQQGEEDQP